SYVGGSKVSTAKRLTNIRTWGGAGMVARAKDYRLAYQSVSGVTTGRLASVTECNGLGGSLTGCLAPISFGWEPAQSVDLFSPPAPSTIFSSTGILSITGNADFNGDGIPDLLMYGINPDFTVNAQLSYGSGSGYTAPALIAQGSPVAAGDLDG